MKKLIYIFSLSFLMSGCYTLLKHPEVENKDDARNIYYSSVNFYDDCARCHNSSQDNYALDYYNYTETYNENHFTGDNYIENPRNRFKDYYNIPWWFSPPTITSSSRIANSPTKSRITTGGSVPDSRPTGATRSDVKLDGTVTKSNRASDNPPTQVKRDDNSPQKEKSATRNNDSNTNNSQNNSDSNTTKSSERTTDDQKKDDQNKSRNSGSTRGKQP
jgi:hypothetical protein